MTRKNGDGLPSKLSHPPTISELAYIAGLFDGEGHVGLNRHYCAKGRTGAGRIRVICQIANTDKSMIDFVQTRFPSRTYAYFNHRNSKRKNYWNWMVVGENAVLFLRAILPFLITKKERALLAIQFHEQKQDLRRFFNVHTEPELSMKREEVERREVLFQKMKELNRRGITPTQQAENIIRGE